MGTIKLSQILKLAGIGLGALGALRIIFAETDGLLVVLEVHWICLIVLGIGAVTWFAGAWEAKHEAAVSVAAAAPKTGTTATTTVVNA